MPKIHQNGDRWVFHCPACNCSHYINNILWKFNGNIDKPTITPSIKVTRKRDITDDEITRIMAGEKINLPDIICHSCVTKGQIIFCNDCTHELAGKTIDLPEWNNKEGFE